MSTREQKAIQKALFALKPKPTPDVPIDLQIMAAGLPPGEEELKFAPGRNWAFDRAWPELKIAFEIEGGGFGGVIRIGEGGWTTKRRKVGGEWVKERVELPAGKAVRLGGRHNQGVGFENDAEKYNTAAILGWMLIRASHKMIKDGRAIAFLEDAFRAKGYAKAK